MTKNVPASIRQKLLNKSNSEKRPFNEVLQYFAMERFLYRLSKSQHAEKFILKGALMLRVWESSEYRPTMDIDMLGKTSNEIAAVTQQIKDMINTSVEPDGITFDEGSIKAERITEDADYEGIRVSFEGKLDNALIHMQIDIGFGDKVHPKPSISSMPTIIALPAPEILCYSKESAIAEKFEAMVKLGEINSRMKDFYDIWVLSRQFDFSGKDLAQAIRLTFNQRKTDLPNNLERFSTNLASNKQIQWAAFKNKLKQDFIPNSFIEVINHNNLFLSPIITSIQLNQDPPSQWTAPNQWS
ncbi:MAG: nucleotidyl transferase AbiEii/AbiGii toxin family protein [Candidatus Berkiella sp.]